MVVLMVVAERMAVVMVTEWMIELILHRGPRLSGAGRGGGGAMLVVILDQTLCMK